VNGEPESVSDEEATRLACEGTDSEWFKHSGHCGHCGNPGNYCTCTAADPCECRNLHPIGSARIPGALAAFGIEPERPEVSEDQIELFGDIA
jgi:hypothetical protein